MSKQELINNRNHLLVKIYWIIFAMDIAVVILYERLFEFSLIYMIFFIVLLLMTFLVKKSKNGIAMMYLLILLIYAYLITINLFDPHVVNFYFLTLPVILSLIYQQISIIFVSAVISLILQTVLFFDEYHDYRFLAEDWIYIAMFIAIILLFFIFFTRYINSLWTKVNEQNMAVTSQYKSASAKLDLLFSQSQDAFVMLDKDYFVITVNPAFESIYGWSSDELAGEKYPLHKGNHLGHHKKSFLQRQDRTKTGKEIEVEVTISPLYDERGKIIVIAEAIRDVSKKREEEQILINAEKLKVAGELAAGFAHEIRNPLTVIQGFLQIMGENKEDSHYTEIMLTEINRINDILNEFLLYSKPQEKQFKQIDLRKVMIDTVEFFNSESLLNNININLNISDNRNVIFGDENQLKQVFINLLKNSCEAMSEGGNISITLSIDKQNQMVILIFEDDGIGIPAELLHEIRKPFFTTKETGTGLGIMISEKIIMQHRGKFDIKSIHNESTTVTIELPLLETSSAISP